MASEPKLMPSERARLLWLSFNPGSWGGHADRGAPCDDPDILHWLSIDFIELRSHRKVLNKHVVSRHGYYLTPAGRIALDGAREGETR